VRLEGKRVLVLGLGETGLAMAKWLAGRGAQLRVADSRDTPPGRDELLAAVPTVELHLGEWRDESFEGIDLIAISPGVPREIAPVQRSLARGVPVVGDVELFAQSLPRSAGRRPLILAITGTNGKTTVTSLTGALCRAAGFDVEVAGNISPSVLAALSAREAAADSGGSAAEVWVLELSSFQLESTASLAPAAATMLNLSEDHLDRYTGMQAYAEAKARIFLGAGAQVLNRDDPASLAMAQPGCRVVSFGLDAPSVSAGPDVFGLIERADGKWLAAGQRALMPVAELRIAGLHNAANALAALALCHAAGLDLSGPAGDKMLQALREFRGLPHRVELVGEHGGVRWYDDSKGTNVGSTVAALAGLGDGGAGRIVLIAGGEGKGQDFSPLKPAVANAARAVVLIGRDAPLIEEALQGSGAVLVKAADMADAVRQAAALAQAGDAVLLSPACASFDMFHNYKHRGEVFAAEVEALAHA
jgi:UDP-N-acetylmuramoylalanine--D-glutamate ligase